MVEKSRHKVLVDLYHINLEINKLFLDQLNIIKAFTLDVVTTTTHIMKRLGCTSFSNSHRVKSRHLNKPHTKKAIQGRD